MKKLLAVLLLLLLITVGYAEESSSGSSVPGAEALLDSGQVGVVTENIPPGAGELLNGGGRDIGGAVESITPQTLVQTVWETAKHAATAPLRLLVSLCGMMVLCAMLEIFHTTLNDQGGRSIFQLVVAVAMASVVVTPVVECITQAATAIHEFSLFITTFIPVLAGVITASGQPLTAVAYNVFLYWICQTTAQLISNYFVPLLCGYLALTVVAVVCPNLRLGRLIGGIKTFAVWGLTLTLTVFVGLFSIQAVVASGGDNVTVKAAKFMIGSLVPGVGGALADLFMAAQGCIQLTKGTLGAFGVVVTLFTFLPPLVQVLMWYLSLNLAGLVGGILGVGELSELVKSISTTLGLLMAVLLYDALLVIISTTMIIVTFGAG